MSLTLCGMCIDVAFGIGESKEIRFMIQDSSGTFTTCDYKFKESLPLRKGDMIFCNGQYEQKIIGGEYKWIFNCTDLTARYEFDLLNFLITYMPYMKIDKKHDIDTVTQYYRSTSEKITDYCITYIGSYSVDNICKLFNGLYKFIEINDEQPLIDFATYCFGNPSVKKIKNFLTIWNNDVLIRPLELLGLNLNEIHSIHIPLYEAYEIIKRNPYRLPQYSIEKAMTIINSHLRLEDAPIGHRVNHEELEYNSIFARICGTISRMVYDNVKKRKWTSTPIDRIKEHFPMYNEYREVLQEYYYCVEDLDHLYFTKIHSIEKGIANKLSYLIKKLDITIREPVFPSLIPSEKQQETIIGALSKYISLIHGGPGTGKTAMTTEIIRNIALMGKKSLCLAFTGAATTRIRDTAIENGVFDLTTIMTINMAITIVTQILEMKPDYIIIDEISMVSSGLMSLLFGAFRTLDYQLILIGDSNQLEPIEWGNFMFQLLKTPITKYHLTENFRSEKTILEICNDVIDSKRIHSHTSVNWNLSGSDYRFTIGDLNVIEQWISYYASCFQIDPSISIEENIENFSKYRDKFTIISPYRKVCDEINPIFQKYFMSHIKEFTEINGNKYYLGDRVMKLINDYGINVMNGEIGKVIKVMPNYIVCIFRDKKETITPYVEKSVFTSMKNFVKKNGIKFNPYKTDPDGNLSTNTEGEKIAKSKEEIKLEVESLKKQYLTVNVEENSTLAIATNQSNDIINLFFSLLEEYPLALYNISEEAEFLNIKNLSLAYCVTTHKSQGSQYEYVLFFLNGKVNSFVTVNNIYVGLSRAKKLLHIITESIQLLNSACLNKQRFVYDKLYERINNKLPPELLFTINQDEIIEETYQDDFDIAEEIYEDDIGY